MQYWMNTSSRINWLRYALDQIRFLPYTLQKLVGTWEAKQYQSSKLYLTKDESNKIFIMAVKSKKIQSFILYCKSENLKYKILKYK